MSIHSDRAFVAMQYLLPKHLLSRFIYTLMRSERPALRNRLLSFFLRHFQVQMDEAIESNPFAYPSFNAFFTRSLKAEVRPIASEPTAFVSPVDGTVSQCGTIEGDGVLQAKGRVFSLRELLANDSDLAAKYAGGTFATIYLAPYNYHRIHMPFAGTVRQTIYVPGDLFSVNAATARNVPRLFARNERVVCDFATESGSFAMIYVGALFVGSMETTWCGEVNPPPRTKKQPIPISDGLGHSLRKGDEAGRFNMGSTVILLAERDKLLLNPSLQPGGVVKMGEKIGTYG